MTIQALSFDILREFLHYISPYDFEALMLSCKSIYSTFQPLLSDHNELRKRYRHFKLFDQSKSDGHGAVVPYTLPQLLYDIALDPVIGDYIIHLDLANRKDLASVLENDKWSIIIEEAMDGASELLLDLLQQSPTLELLDTTPSQLSAWVDCIIEETVDIERKPCPDFALPILLSLLPNIETLTLSGHWTVTTVTEDPDEDDYDYDSDDEEVELAKETNILVRNLMKLLIDRANDERLTDQPLSKLHTLYPSDGIDTQYGDEIDSIFPFLALKSLHTVHRSDGTLDLKRFNEQGNSNSGIRNNDQNGDVWSPDTGSDVESMSIWQRYPLLGPNIEHLLLNNCVISADACEKLLQNMKQLSSFHYQHTTKEGSGVDWNPDGFVQGISSSVGRSLKKLSILAGFIWEGSECTTIHNPIDGFENLQHLELDGYFLFERDESKATPLLIQILPRSLQTFILHMSTENYRCLTDVFAEFKESRKKAFPSLTHVELRVRDVDQSGYSVGGHDKYLAEVRSIAETNGVIVTSNCIL